MNNNELQEIINNTKTNNKIKWNNESISYQISLSNEYSTYIFNKDGNHGCFALLHNIVSEVDGIIVELGNREGMSTIAIYDALKPNSKFYTLDIVDDLRFVDENIKKDQRVFIMNDFNSLDSDRISKEFKEKSISVIFFDTIHTYEQIKQEHEIWKPYLKDDCVLVVDDIMPVNGFTKWKWHEEMDDEYHRYDVTEWAHSSGYGLYMKKEVLV
jgi:predicted O-methyltransferase YrrM